MSAATIQVLDERTANKIAAGEVIEKPSSVVKELVENSIDAQSHNIIVEITGGGLEYISVLDDGHGMGAEDAELCILRHATSKIKCADDLTAIATLGFRGEALPSIAAVSRFTLLSRPADQDFATLVTVAGGKISEVREAGGPTGTKITVTDLFYNTPARKKFLKSPATESTNIHQIITKLALSHPDIAFKLINGNRTVLSTPGNGEPLSALTGLYGGKIAPEILKIEYRGEVMAINGYIGKPTLLKSNRHWQTFIVNNRVVNNRVMLKALDNAYYSLLPHSGHPLALINITLPGNMIDVNVHPQKSEIKFADDSQIFKAIYAAVTTALESPGPENLTMVAQNIYSSPPVAGASAAEVANSGGRINMFKEEGSDFAEEVWGGTANISRPLENEINEPAEFPAEADLNLRRSLSPLGQIAGCYIVAEAVDGLYLIDQHAAHERILFDRLQAGVDNIPAQQLLAPAFIDIDETEAEIVEHYANILAPLGFDVELAGPNAARVRGIPSLVPPTEAAALLRAILDRIREADKPEPREIRQSCLQMAACRSAIKAGDRLNIRQMQALLEELGATSSPYTCPHGRPVIIRFGTDDLAKLFKR